MRPEFCGRSSSHQSSVYRQPMSIAHLPRKSSAARLPRSSKRRLVRCFKRCCLQVHQTRGRLGRYRYGTSPTLRVRCGLFFQLRVLRGGLRENPSSWGPVRRRSILGGHGARLRTGWLDLVRWIRVGLSVCSMGGSIGSEAGSASVSSAYRSGLEFSRFAGPRQIRRSGPSPGGTPGWGL